MASVQEMETKIAQLARMVEFVMKAISVSQPSPLAGMPPRVTNLLNLYHASQQAGLAIADTLEGEVVDSEKVSEANHA